MARYLLDRLPLVRRLYEQIEKEGLFPAGHYYSPIPDRDELIAHLNPDRRRTKRLDDIDLNVESQQATLDEYSRYYADVPFPEEPDNAFRYYYNNPMFSYADAIFLHCFLRKHEPAKIIEVGSGFSSAVLLDTAERFFSRQPDVTLIEPDPVRLKHVLKPGDEKRVTMIEEKVQSVPTSLFESLSPGDLLFIDSSHVMKCGSDVQFLFFEIIPSLPKGIFVHVHDVFYPFEYPHEWLEEGRYWNENYFVRAFLAYNSEWNIAFFNSFIEQTFESTLREKMPLCLKSPGQSIYLQRKLPGSPSASPKW